MHTNGLNEKILSDNKKREKILNNIIKSKVWQYSFQCINKYIGRGKRKSLARVHEVDSSQKIIKTCIGKEEIEKVIASSNRMHSTKDCKIKIFNDKICVKL